MDNRIYPQRFAPVVTGSIQFGTPHTEKAPQINDSESFQNILREKISQTSSLNFSKHAVSRVMERGIDLSESSISRLNEGVKIAEQKGLDDTLILIDRTAFIVSIKNNTVITTVNEEDLKGNVFTNIDGTVII